MKKRIGSLVMILALCLGLLTGCGGRRSSASSNKGGSANSGSSGSSGSSFGNSSGENTASSDSNGIDYVLASEEDITIEDGTLAKYTGPGGNVAFPSSVTSIGDFALADCISLTGVSIPDSVTYVSLRAFTGCTGLTNIDVSDGNQNYTDIDGVLFSKDMTILHTYPAGRQAGSYSIPDSVTSIGDRAFFRCSSLTSVTIPSSVNDIGAYAFVHCTGLTGISVDSGNRSYTDIDGVLFSKDVTELYVYPAGMQTSSYSIPSSVTGIGFHAFEDCTGLASISIPSSVTKIEESAFSDCSSLTDIYYGGSEAQWSAIDIGLYNNQLTDVAIHYNS